MALDPQLQALVDALPNGLALPVGDAVSAREAFRTVTVAVRDHQPPADLASTEDLEVPAAEGDLPARIYRPHGDGPTPTFIFIHGGGFVVGDIEAYDFQARQLAERMGVTVISLHYRLAPEFPWPAATEDIMVSARWVLDNIDKLGGDPSRVLIGGDSAGGNLAAVVADQLVDEEPGIAGIVLLYPVIDFGTPHPSLTEHASGPVLTGEAGQLFSTAYLEKPLAAGADLADPLISPINFDRLADLPPTLVVTAKYDILHDSGVDYAERAKAAGGNVTHLNYDTLPHGFLGLTPMSTASDAAVDEFCRAALDLLS